MQHTMICSARGRTGNNHGVTHVYTVYSGANVCFGNNGNMVITHGHPKTIMTCTLGVHHIKTMMSPFLGGHHIRTA